MTDAMDSMDEIEQFLSMHADQLLAGEVASEGLPSEVVGPAGLLTNLRTAIDADDYDALAAVNGTVPVKGGQGTVRRSKSTPPARSSATPTSTSQPNVAPSWTSVPESGSSTPANPTSNGSPNPNRHAGGNANGSANGHAPANGKAKGNASGNGKTTGNGNGNGNAHPSGAGNPPGKGRKSAV